MKNKWFLLFKASFTNMYKLKALTKKKVILIILVAIYVIGVLFAGLSFFLSTLFNSLNKVGLSSYFIILIYSLASIFSFVFTIFSAKSGLFDSKDNNLLLSLPIKKSDILISRLVFTIGYNLLLGLFFIIPGIIIYINNISINITSIISIIFLTILFPIIPTVLACIFGYLVAALTAKSNKKNVLELIYYVLFIVLYFLVYGFSNKIMNYLINDITLLNNILKYLFFPIYLMGKCVLTGNLLYLLLFLVINIAVFVGFILIFKRNYFKIIFKLSSNNSKSNYKMHILTTHSIKKALIIKELKRYFSSAIYVFNTIFGVFFIIIAAGASFFYSSDKIISTIQTVGTDIPFTSFSIVFCLLVFAISLTDTTNSCISIEKDSFWITKTLPVETKDILYSKIYVNKIILIPACILSIIIFWINGYMNFYELLLLGIFSYMYSSFIANFGLIANLLFPKFDALNDTAIVKQSVASFAGIMGGFVLAIVFIVLSVAITNNLVLLLLSNVIAILVYILTNIIIKKWGYKRFQLI